MTVPGTAVAQQQGSSLLDSAQVTEPDNLTPNQLVALLQCSQTPKKAQFQWNQATWPHKFLFYHASMSFPPPFSCKKVFMTQVSHSTLHVAILYCLSWCKSILRHYYVSSDKGIRPSLPKKVSVSKHKDHLRRETSLGNHTWQPFSLWVWLSHASKLTVLSGHNPPSCMVSRPPALLPMRKEKS